MLSKNEHKLITSLQQKKYRIQHQLFVAEGVKVVNEFLNSNLQIEKLFCVEDYYQSISKYKPELISEKELSKLSNLSTPNKVIGVFKIPQTDILENKGLIVALDSVNDPGNLGTIIRLCDWFGVSQLVCSTDTVDCYNSKVVQATMGSLTRLPIIYTDLKDYLSNAKIPIYGAVMDGKIVKDTELKKNAILVMGNESNGISPEIENLLSHRITIPRFNNKNTPESLNVATATAILLNEFCGR
ncbi:RNA methyltransferase [Aureibaculum sp. 2210JD6-5]|uniref:TrmH family RNA methyltransferase n=1 Tax=Aureibaculum sp. 2210JD6-5 TaxID=3103957 RepID=UPI002AAD2780|nr:RNA methyltransferase [Aureibaculum sp. 2210JD6-5]MDY7395670.1 RNA methyltransferase [Aureibaculum sp. 2210JD6-5]